MGGALAARLQLSHELVVFDKASAAAEAMAKLGATVAVSLPALAEACEMIFLCLPTSDHVQDALFSQSGLACGLRPNTIVIDQTTGDPNLTRQFAERLTARRVELVDAPVSGGIAGAQAGTIAIMVGASTEQMRRIRPILEAISPNIFHAGGIGNGHVIKLVNNLMSTAQRLLSFEAMTLAAKNGVDPKTAVDILLAGGGRNAYLERMMKPRILEGKLNVGFTLGLAHKDARLACQLGVDTGVPMFFGNITREMYQLCIAQNGRDAQVDTCGQVIDRLAGTAVVPAATDLGQG
jgi:3-hydroxyisobutyrate dehydrogenase